MDIEVTEVNVVGPDEQAKKVVLKSLERDRAKLLMHMPFIGSILMQLTLKAVDDFRCPTACTDYKNIFVSTNFYKSLNDKQRLFVLAHEAWHTVLFHLGRRQTRENERWNVAADLEIHFVLQNDMDKCQMEEPWVLPHDDSWSGKSAEEIYALLPDGVEKDCQQDEHISSTSEGESPEQASKRAQGQGVPEVHIDPDFTPVQHNSEESVKKLGEEIRESVISAAQRHEMTRGSLPNHIEQIVGKYRRSKVNWRNVLKNFVMKSSGDNRRWLPPARRYISQGYYLPSRSSEKFTGVVAIDSSGSISEELTERFFGELRGLMKTFPKYELYVIDCDAEIQHVEKYTEVNPPSEKHGTEFKRYGWGGTSFIPVFKYVKENKIIPNCLIYFTDLYGDFPTQRPKYPVIWLTPTRDYDKIPFGRKLIVDE